MRFNQLLTLLIVYTFNIQVKYFPLAYAYFLYIIKGMKKKLGRPPKPAGQLRDENILVRLGQEEKEAFKEAADLAGISLSAWVRERLRRVAINELQQAERPIAFLK